MIFRSGNTAALSPLLTFPEKIPDKKEMTLPLLLPLGTVEGETLRDGSSSFSSGGA
jgi:hypothetical protein